MEGQLGNLPTGGSTAAQQSNVTLYVDRLKQVVSELRETVSQLEGRLVLVMEEDRPSPEKPPDVALKERGPTCSLSEAIADIGNSTIHETMKLRHLMNRLQV